LVEAAGGEKVYTEGKDGSPVMCKQELEQGLLSFFGFDGESTKGMLLNISVYIQSCFSVQVSLN
jgi:hypothetical protein